MVRIRTWTLAIIVIAVEAAALIVDPGATRTAAQAPVSTPGPAGQMAPIPGTASVPPGGTVTFTNPPPTPMTGATTSPGGPAAVRVDNQSDQPAIVTYDGRTLTIEVPIGYTPQVQQVQGLSRASCAPASDQPHVVSCTPVFSRPISFFAFTAVAASARPEAVALDRGCTNIVLAWPVGTPLGTVTAAVMPPGALESVFKFDPAMGRFRGFSPVAPALVNDYTRVEARLEAVFICLRAVGMLARPPAGAQGGSQSSPVVGSQPQDLDAIAEGTYDRDTIVVSFWPGTLARERVAAVERLGGRIISEAAGPDEFNQYGVSVPPGMDAKTFVRLLRMDPVVRYAELIIRYFPPRQPA